MAKDAKTDPKIKKSKETDKVLKAMKIAANTNTNNKSDTKTTSKRQPLKWLVSKMRKNNNIKARPITTRAEQLTATTASRIIKENPELIDKPNKVWQQANLQTLQAAHDMAFIKVGEYLNQNVSEEAKHTFPPTIKDNNGQPIIKYVNPITDIGMAISDKLEKITTIENVHQLSTLLLCPPIATVCQSRIPYWEQFLATASNSNIQKLIHIAVAHYHLSACQED